MTNAIAGLQSQIRDAWQPAVYPGDDRICTPTYDDEGVAAYFRGRTWRDHDVASLRYHEVGLSFFTAEAFCYYLAAYMLAVLDDMRAADVIYDGILFHLSPDQLGKQWADRYTAKLEGFSPAQLRAIVAYLEWCAADGAYRHADIEATLAYLTTRTVPRATSPVERLLQLSGARNFAREGEDPRATLTTLRLSHTKVEDADLVALGEFPELRELDLGGAAITDAGLACLPGVAHLEILDLSGCSQLTAAGLAHVGKVATLVDLKLSNVGPDDAGLAALAPLRLRRLDLVHANKLTDAGWAALELDHLETLKMFGVGAPDAMLARLGRAGKLRELETKTLGDAGLVALCQAASLIALEIGDADRVTEVGLAALAALPQLRTLGLGRLAAERWPAGFPALETLTLLDVALRATHADGLGQLPSLAELRMFGGPIEPGVLIALRHLPRLRDVTMWKTSVTDEMVEELAGCAALEKLSLRASSFTGAGLAVVSQLPALITLRLDDLPAFDEASLAALASAPRLRELVFEAVPVTDAGLATLASCPELHAIRLTRTKVTAAGLAAFRKAHATIDVIEL